MSKCRICKNSFEKKCREPWCSPECAAIWYANQRTKRLEAEGRKVRKEIRQRKEALKTRSDYMKEAQREFNAFIRERDKHSPCICCGAPLVAGTVGGGYDAGHYRSVGSAPHLRFSEDNCWGQTKKCNRYGAGRAVDYRRGLIDRIGLARVEALEADQSVKKWNIDELKAIRDLYRRKRRELQRNGDTSARHDSFSDSMSTDGPSSDIEN